MDERRKTMVDLTEEERKYLFGQWRCPDCGDKKQFLAGPKGGLAQNIMCNTCKSKFNVTPPFFAERI
jgi:transcription elongation factor Elf1